ncbi:MAG: phosphoribosylformylglycinamidine synthase [Clostridia bacterium]|nr:phosphoribosylformylglycinamidine synthase [Clostridia bacterium]
MVYRLFVEKKEGLSPEADILLGEIREILGIKGLRALRILNRYDAEGLSEDDFEGAVGTVFSEPQTDRVYRETPPDLGDASVFAAEYLPGQFDQRADSASQCIALMTRGSRPVVRSAKVYALYGDLTDGQIAAVKKHVINPVDSREASLDKPATLKTDYAEPDPVKTLDGFCDASVPAEDIVKQYGLAMDAADVEFCREYFRSENREPTLTELRVIDTYWSDHCRHTTFLTTIDSVSFDDPVIEKTYREYLRTREQLGVTKPVTLMNIATLAVKKLKAEGKLDALDESDEINACTVRISVEIDGKVEPWLLLFKNETHNHPTEIEPFGGAATCIGGAIRDPLSGRSYVYAAMRVTGAGDPTAPVENTRQGKLPQRKLCTTAAAGYSSYGNQIGLATGIVDEIYHPGYEAKRMEIGAVIAATPAKSVRRETPAPGDPIILVGGRTGRDGCGGATGSSKSHEATSIETCGAEVQKGNAPEERKLQRLFRDPDAARMIKRCNDFGAGGVSVAIGELADGLSVDLDLVPKKYEGLDGTELAISESQERMAVVTSPEDADAFIAIAERENLEATVVAYVTEEKRLTMRWRGDVIVDLSREFLSSNGAEKHVTARVGAADKYEKEIPSSFGEGFKKTVSDLNVCSRRGLIERFDSTIGAGTVLMPLGGKNQATPSQAMVHKISTVKGETDDVSVMAWGFDPYLSEKSPYHGAYLAVVTSVTKLVAAGAAPDGVYLTFQEYFEKLGADPDKWGRPLSALLGAFRAQCEYGIGSIGGKDSMSGTFEDISVPPTLVSFAVTTDKAERIISGEFKRTGDRVIVLAPEFGDDGLPIADSQKEIWKTASDLIGAGKVAAAYAPGAGGAAEAIAKMCFGNGLGFRFEDVSLEKIFSPAFGSLILEVTEDVGCGEALGAVTADAKIARGDEAVDLGDIKNLYDARLEGVYPVNVPGKAGGKVENVSFSASAVKAPAILVEKPKVVIPVFPGTNCEYDSARAVEEAGAIAETVVVENVTADGVNRSVERMARAIGEAQMIFIPGGFSGGDEPDGSGKFITAFFRNDAVRAEVDALLTRRDGLICGICNGFQALVKLGLVPYGRITEAKADDPTLTFNTISRHQSRIVRVRVASNMSPWLSGTKPGDVFSVPISHGEGRFFCSDEWVRKLKENGQIATQYADADGDATADIDFNPNGSVLAIEGITSPDGRVFGKMGHAERVGKWLYKNVPGNYDMGMFRAAVKYFRGK